MNLRIVMLCTAAVLALGSCSKEPPCDDAAIQKKSQEFVTAAQAAMVKNPAKATEIQQKLIEVAQKYQAANSDKSQACKALDELTKSLPN